MTIAWEQLAQEEDPEVTVRDVATLATPEALAEGQVQLVDVRELDEWETGHIAGAVLIPMSELLSRLNEVAQDRPVVTVCRSGRRSLIVIPALRAAGVTSIASMAGGMLAWNEAGLPMETGTVEGR